MTADRRPAPRWALWNSETEAWDEVPAGNAPGLWRGGHEYGQPAVVEAEALARYKDRLRDRVRKPGLFASCGGLGCALDRAEDRGEVLAAIEEADHDR